MLLFFLDKKGKTSTDAEMENTSLKSLSTHPTRTESINASHNSGNGSLNSCRIFTEMDANKNCQFGKISSSTDEEMKSISENNASIINGSCNNKRRDTGLDAKENHHYGMS